MKSFSDMMCNAYEKVIAHRTEEIARSIVNKTIKHLQSLKRDSGMMQTSDDDILENIWDEYCVQVQGVESIFFDTYEDYIKTYISSVLHTVSENDKKMMWFQTDDFQEWSNCESDIDDELEHMSSNDYSSKNDSNPKEKEFFSDDGLPAGYNEDAVIMYVFEYVMCEAGNYSNRRIERFLGRW